jgi:hypothetical protein
MDTNTKAIAHRVDAARRGQGVEIRPLSVATGIPRVTLTRMLAGDAEFKTSQLLRVAHELKADAASWITDLPKASRVAA